MNGNPGKRPIKPDEPTPPPGRPEPPQWLSSVALEKWRETIALMEEMRTLSRADGSVLAGFCIAWAELQHATETLQAEGRFTTRGTGGKCSHPAVVQQRTALKAVRDFAAVLGLDPTSRTRLHTAPLASEDKLVAFLAESAAS